jgi:hypothetical protein
VLSDDEIQTLREIERRLRWHSPELVRLFDGVESQPEAKHRQRASARALLAGAALTCLTLLGPRMLNEAEVRTRRRQPLPRTAPAAPIPVQTTVADKMLGPSTTQITRHGPYTEMVDGRPLVRIPVHVESLNRETLTGRQITARGRRQVPTTAARAELERR